MKLNDVFKVQDCPICGKEPFVGACEDADGSEATIRCPCGLEYTQLYEYLLPDQALKRAVAEWNRLTIKTEGDEK